MNKSLLVAISFFISFSTSAQHNKLQQAVKDLQEDSQFSNAVISLYVADEKGKVVFEVNSRFGLTPASTLKVITGISAFELLGKNYRFKTYLHAGNGKFILSGFGDPTFGSSRWESTQPQTLLEKIRKVYEKSGSPKKIYINDMNLGYQPVPDGWVWQDVGNYYGAGAWGVNWMENTFQAFLRSPAEPGRQVMILKTLPAFYGHHITNMITSGSKGSGDNAYLYSAPYSENIFATGTVPAGENSFRISGSMPYPSMQLARELEEQLSANDTVITFSSLFRQKKDFPADVGIVDSVMSPSLDSINYWFMQKSINLYGEALVKAIALSEGIEGTGEGIKIMKEYWKKKLNLEGMNIIDGSGLSPGNRVTSKTLVDLLLYARSRPWHGSFYGSLPQMNGMKMKSGYMTGVRSYTGWVTNKIGETFAFAFIVNNFTGNPAQAREKMWKVLDLLK